MPVSASDLQLIRNGFYRTLTACGPYSACDVSACDFGILDTIPGACAVMFMPGTSTFTPLAIGTQPSRWDNRGWGITGQVWVKEINDPVTFNGRIWQAHDDLYNTIQKDNSLNNTCQNARVTQMQFIADGNDKEGQHWGVVQFTIVAEMFG